MEVSSGTPVRNLSKTLPHHKPIQVQKKEPLVFFRATGAARGATSPDPILPVFTPEIKPEDPYSRNPFGITTNPIALVQMVQPAPSIPQKFKNPESLLFKYNPALTRRAKKFTLPLKLTGFIRPNRYKSEAPDIVPQPTPRIKIRALHQLVWE